MKDKMIVKEFEGTGILSLDINYNGLSESYKQTTDVTGRQFNEFLQENGLTVNPDSIWAFLSDIRKKFSQRTYNLKRQQLKKLLKEQPQISNNYMLRGFIDEMFKNIKSINMENKKAKIDGIDYLSREQILEMIELTKNTKHKMIIEFLFKTGCRVSEMLNIRLNDIKLNSKAIITVIGKRCKARDVFITRGFYESLRGCFQGKTYLIEHNGKQYSRMQVFRVIRKAGQKIGVEIHPHTLRHSFAMYLKELGKGVKYISKALGHATTQITADHYFHDSPGEEIADLF